MLVRRVAGAPGLPHKGLVLRPSPLQARPASAPLPSGRPQNPTAGSLVLGTALAFGGGLMAAELRLQQV